MARFKRAYPGPRVHPRHARPPATAIPATAALTRRGCQRTGDGGSCHQRHPLESPVRPAGSCHAAAVCGWYPQQVGDNGNNPLRPRTDSTGTDVGYRSQLTPILAGAGLQLIGARCGDRLLGQRGRSPVTGSRRCRRDRQPVVTVGLRVSRGAPAQRLINIATGGRRQARTSDMERCDRPCNYQRHAEPRFGPDGFGDPNYGRVWRTAAPAARTSLDFHPCPTRRRRSASVPVCVPLSDSPALTGRRDRGPGPGKCACGDGIAVQPLRHRLAPRR